MEKIVKKNIAIVFGGNSVEHDVSILTKRQVVDAIDKDLYNIFEIYIDLNNNLNLVKSDGKFTRLKPINIINGKLNGKIKLYSVINCCHGGVGENGVLKAFFDLHNVKMTSSNFLTLGICMDKYRSKMLLKSIGIPVVDSRLIKSTDNLDKVLDDEFFKNKNVIVKPNHLGSSIGVFESNDSNLIDYILANFNYDNEVIVERKVENLKEYNIAVLKKGNEFILSEIECPTFKKGVLSFEDKYLGSKKMSKSSSRQLPAKISVKLKSKINEIALKVANFLNFSGVVRIDFLYDDSAKNLYLNEINTVPGSLAFYLFENKGISFRELINILIENSSCNEFVYSYLDTKLK